MNRDSNWLNASVAVFIALVCFSVAGCRTKLSDQRTIQVAVGDIESIVVAPAANAQTIQISATSTGGPINVHVFLLEDQEAVERAITLKTSTDKVLGSQLNAKQISFAASIPANKEAVVRFETAANEAAVVNSSVTN